MTNPTRNLIASIEGDLVDLHRARMAERQGQCMAELHAERAKPTPDPAVIDAIKARLVQLERDKHDVSITERELLAPLRAQLAQEDEAREVGSVSLAEPGPQ